MATLIKVDPAKLRSASSEIKTQAADYQRYYEQLFTIVTNLQQGWQGKDNLAFTEQIKGFEDDFRKMKSLMNQYAEYLSITADNYQNTQDDRVVQVRKLTN